VSTPAHLQPLVDLVRLELAGAAPAERVALFTAIADGYCGACGYALELVDAGALGKLPRACSCEDDT